jgi:hypothetical protein
MYENELRDKLRKIEALFSSATMDGEKYAASEAIRRIKEKLAKFNKQEKSVEFRFSLPDRWSRQLFIALCRRYDIKPYRYGKQRQTSIMLKAPQTFINDIFYPEFQALNGALIAYLNNVTEKIIKEEIYHDVSEADEMNAITQL